ncbi:ABC-type sugar transport system substrate-binding protein [Streptomyces sp. DSM 40167]|nr:ABC-type sugar transport system substrate-binding protein [Streptomyces sp. DSM 40167]
MSSASTPRRRRSRAVLLATLTAALAGTLLAGPGPAAPRAQAAPAAFTHPGVTVSEGQLDFARAKVQAGA